MRTWILGVLTLLLVLFLVEQELHAAVEGSSSGIFVNPQGPPGMVTNGVGTNFFTWGVGIDGPPSSLELSGKTFVAEFEKVFSLGTLRYFNGSIQDGTEANKVDLEVT